MIDISSLSLVYSRNRYDFLKTVLNSKLIGRTEGRLLLFYILASIIHQTLHRSFLQYTQVTLMGSHTSPRVIPFSKFSKQAFQYSRPSNICSRSCANRTRYFSHNHVRPASITSSDLPQLNVGSKGPTAMVFMNMGGPSTTDEVGDFLSRLFVRAKYFIIFATALFIANM